MRYISFPFFKLLLRRKENWDAHIGKMPDYQRKPFVNDDAKMVLIVEGGCLKTAYGAGFIKALDNYFGVEFGGAKSIMHLVDEVVVISGGAPIALASASGNLDKAPDIFRILTSGDFFSTSRLAHSVYHLAKSELMSHNPKANAPPPSINLQFAMDALKNMGVDFDAFNRLGINITYLTTDAETGKRIAIRNPEGDLTTLAPRASMTIPYIAGDPLRIDGTYVHDGGFSQDPSGYEYAVKVLGASHVLCASNNHAEHITQDEKRTFDIISLSLRDRPGALKAYQECHLRMREIHDDAAGGHITSAIHNGGYIANDDNHTLCLETTFPEEHSRFNHLERRAAELLNRIQTGYDNGELIAMHYLHDLPLPELRGRPCPTTIELDAFRAYAAAGSTILWAAPTAMFEMASAATRFGMNTAAAGMRSIPFWGSAISPSTPPDQAPR